MHRMPKNESFVETPEGVGTVTQVNLLKETVKVRLEEQPEAVLEGSAKGWVTDLQKNSSGRVESATVGGVPIRGTRLRSILGLRSACFTVECGEEDITFRVTGFGHGVGMSQYGADALAREGKSWQEILRWYYRGVSIETWK